MKKNGFIATSLIYSFFLFFCALLVGFVAMSVHNKTLVDKLDDDIKKELLDKKDISSLEIGNYVKVNIFSSYDEKSIKWMVYKIDSNYVYLISDSYLYQSVYDSYDSVTTDLNSKFHNVYLSKIDLPNSSLDSSITKTTPTYYCASTTTTVNCDTTANYFIKKQLLYTDYDVGNDAGKADGKEYLIYTNNNLYNYGCTLTPANPSLTTPTPEYISCEKGSLVDNTTSNLSNIRATIQLPSSVLIDSGNGTLNNPYVLEYYVTDGLIYHLSAKNPYGNALLTSTETVQNKSITDISSNNIGDITNIPINYDATNKVYSLTFGNNPISTTIDLSKFITSSNYTIEINKKYSDAVTLSGSSTTTNQVSLAANIYGTTNYQSTIDLIYDSTKDASNYTVYVDGISKSTIAKLNASGNLKISGTISSIRIYNRALTPEEINKNVAMDKRWN